jgi:hypothetical protein
VEVLLQVEQMLRSRQARSVVDVDVAPLPSMISAILRSIKSGVACCPSFTMSAINSSIVGYMIASKSLDTNKVCCVRSV